MSVFPQTIAGAGGRYRMAVSGCLETAIGDRGLSVRSLTKAIDGTAAALAEMKVDATTGRLPLLSIVREAADIDAASAALVRLSEGARTILFFGTGGSGLGGQTLAQFSGWNIPGAAGPQQMQRPRIRFCDNLDAVSLADALERMDLATTRFVLTSKSGNTPETLVQAMAALQMVKARGLEADIPNFFLGLTEPAVGGKPNGLRALCQAHAIPTLSHHLGIGGRYSVLSNVGLLPALARGSDAHALRAGAAKVVDELLGAASPETFAPAVGAALSVALHAERGVDVQVMMPYADRLQRFAAWFVQLWAESLGKSGRGTTPIACLGPLDHHSQLQLFMDGPNKHLITIIRLASAGKGTRIDPALARLAGLDVMAGRTVGDLVAAQAWGVPAALGEARRPVRSFDLDHLDEAAMGGLLMHFMIETILAGRLLGVDPFDQPAVELGKVLARKRLEQAP